VPGLILVAWLATGAPALAAPVPAVSAPRVLVIALPIDEAKKLIRERDAAVGVGVFPDSREGSDFWTEVGAGSPQSRAGERSPLAGRGCVLDQGATLPAGDGPARDALRRAFCGGAGPGVTPIFETFAAQTSDEAGFVLDGIRHTGPAVIFGVSPRTPVLVGLTQGRGVLVGGLSRRPGIITPYDVSATLLALAGRRESSVIGKPLHVRADRDPVTVADRIAARLVRDAHIGPGITAATIPVLLGGGIVLTGLFLLFGAPSLAIRAARGGAAGVIGYVASLFVQTGNAGIRAIPVAAAFAIAAGLPVGDAARVRREVAWLLGIAAVAIALLEIAAQLRPGGEPALSLWGDPLVSWRLYGLRNHLSAMLQLGAIGAVPLLSDRADWRAQAAWAAPFAFVLGAPILGAQYEGILTLVFGATLVGFVLWRRRATIAGLVASGVVAVGAFAGVLLWDAGSPVSHGGQAVRSVRAGGWHAAWRFMTIRWRLNVDLIGSIWGGWVWTSMLAVGLVALIVWGVRDGTLRTGTRAVLIGGGLAAIAALVLEDSGFLSGGTSALLPGLAAGIALAERVRPRFGRALDAGG